MSFETLPQSNPGTSLTNLNLETNKLIDVSTLTQAERSSLDKKLAARRAELAVLQAETAGKLLASKAQVEKLGRKSNMLVRTTHEMQRLLREEAGGEGGSSQPEDLYSPLSATQSQ